MSRFTDRLWRAIKCKNRKTARYVVRPRLVLEPLEDSATLDRRTVLLNRPGRLRRAVLLELTLRYLGSAQ